jgi:hypothetical protein
MLTVSLKTFFRVLVFFFFFFRKIKEIKDIRVPRNTTYFLRDP